MEEVVLKAKSRDVIGKQVRAIRRAGLLPAVVYGVHIGSIPISLDYHSASRVLPHVSSSQLIKVDIEGGEVHSALIRERQRHPVTGLLIHVDFMAVSLTEKLTTMVSIDMQGDSPAVKMFNGVLVTGQEEIEVEALPGDLPERIVVNMALLKKIGDAVYVRDLPSMPGVEVLTDPDEMIVLVTAPTLETAGEGEEEEEAAPAGDVEPEVIERGKKEEEE